MCYCFDKVSFDLACYGGENLFLADTHVVKEVVESDVEAVVEEGVVETFVEQRVKLLNIFSLIALETESASTARSKADRRGRTSEHGERHT